MASRDKEPTTSGPVEILLSDRAKEAYLALDDEQRREVGRFMRTHLDPQIAARDPELDVPGTDLDLHIAVAPEGYGVVYRKLGEEEADRVGADAGYLVADVIGNLASAPFLMGAVQLPVATVAEAFARSFADLLSRQMWTFAQDPATRSSEESPEVTDSAATKQA